MIDDPARGSKSFREPSRDEASGSSGLFVLLGATVDFAVAFSVTLAAAAACRRREDDGEEASGIPSSVCARKCETRNVLLFSKGLPRGDDGAPFFLGSSFFKGDEKLDGEKTKRLVEREEEESLSRFTTSSSSSSFPPVFGLWREREREATHDLHGSSLVPFRQTAAEGRNGRQKQRLPLCRVRRASSLFLLSLFFLETSDDAFGLCFSSPPLLSHHPHCISRVSFSPHSPSFTHRSPRPALRRGRLRSAARPRARSRCGGR